MRAIKRTFDPENLLNPGKVVPLRERGRAQGTQAPFTGLPLTWPAG